MNRDDDEGKKNKGQSKTSRIRSSCLKRHHYRTADSDSDAKCHLNQQSIELKEILFN